MVKVKPYWPGRDFTKYVYFRKGRKISRQNKIHKGFRRLRVSDDATG